MAERVRTVTGHEGVALQSDRIPLRRSHSRRCALVIAVQHLNIIPFCAASSRVRGGCCIALCSQRFLEGLLERVRALACSSGAMVIACLRLIVYLMAVQAAGQV